LAAERRILVVAAHPDDEILGAGATMAMHVSCGDHVGVLILGEGERSRAPAGAAVDDAVTQLGILAERAAAAVGAELLERREFPDNAFDTVPLLEIVRSIEQVVERYHPALVYTHFGGDLNIDHELTCRAVVTATRPVRAGSPDLLSFEVRSSTDWADAMHPSRSFQPNTWVAASDDAVDRKFAALRVYEREMRPFPHSRSYEAARALLRHRGAQAGVAAAEAFVLLRSIR